MVKSDKVAVFPGSRFVNFLKRSLGFWGSASPEDSKEATDQAIQPLIHQLKDLLEQRPDADPAWERQRQAGYYNALAVISSHPPAERARIRSEMLDRIQQHPENARIVGNAQGALDHLLQLYPYPPELTEVSRLDVPADPNERIDLLIAHLQQLKHGGNAPAELSKTLVTLWTLTLQQWGAIESR